MQKPKWMKYKGAYFPEKVLDNEIYVKSIEPFHIFVYKSFLDAKPFYTWTWKSIVFSSWQIETIQWDKFILATQIGSSTKGKEQESTSKMVLSILQKQINSLS